MIVRYIAETIVINNLYLVPPALRCLHAHKTL
jgi:hypothetical protein